MQKIRQMVPWTMAAGRALMGPVIVIGDRCGWSGLALAAMVVSALVSDIFDGMLARRWRVDTAAVRLFDSMCDMVFYLCVGTALWFFQPRLISGNVGVLCALLAVEAANFAANFAKYGRPASYHSYLAKAWGLVLASAIAAAFAAAHATALMRIALWMGIASNLETIAMSLMLPVWRRDVKTIAEAWRIRKEICGCGTQNALTPAAPQDCGRIAGWVERAMTWAGSAIIAGLSMMATSAFAQTTITSPTKKLAHPILIDGYLCARGDVRFWENGRLEECKVARPTAFGEATIPKGSFIMLTVSGEPKSADLSRDAVIHGVKCWGGTVFTPMTHSHRFTQMEASGVASSRGTRRYRGYRVRKLRCSV
ncbi:MAG TPA: CDP-alcohol phosphatidyltransferase family protein [Acidobacteriaceae bacterium]|nr:CDP-alcohol phosphatidyltransferase family protein [Acidobacteriaceae bacterium]